VARGQKGSQIQTIGRRLGGLWLWSCCPAPSIDLTSGSTKCRSALSRLNIGKWTGAVKDAQCYFDWNGNGSSIAVRAALTEEMREKGPSPCERVA
jgi:hypothetical protein